jgi:hypothetical protein
LQPSEFTSLLPKKGEGREEEKGGEKIHRPREARMFARAPQKRLFPAHPSQSLSIPQKSTDVINNG